MPENKDLETQGVDVLPSVLRMTLFLEGQSAAVEVSLPGTVVVDREAASVSHGGGVQGRLRMRTMEHAGPTPLGRMTARLRQPAKGAFSREEGQSWFTVEFFEVALDVTLGDQSFETDPVNVTTVTREIPPPSGTVYTHRDAVQIRQAGQLIGRALAQHIIDGREDKEVCPPHTCCPPPQSLRTHGCFGCIELRARPNGGQQTIFQAPDALARKDRTLVYACITNNGPDALALAVDGTAGAALVRPGQTTAVAAQSSIVATLGGQARHASGFYVLDHCCPHGTCGPGNSHGR